MRQPPKSKMLRIVYAAFILFAFSGVHAYTCNCSGRNYNNTDIFTAINKGYQIDQTASQSGGQYPQRYANPDNIEYPWCGNGHFAQYPLVKVPPGPFESGDPGPDRVIYLVGTRRTFCGCMTLADGPENAGDLILCENGF